jgi:hypothetical protein
MRICLVLSSDIDGRDRKMHLISFKDLFEIFSKSLGVEERMLLFYLILVENESFRVYVLSRTDQETIVSSLYYMKDCDTNSLYTIVSAYIEIDL